MESFYKVQTIPVQRMDARYKKAILQIAENKYKNIADRRCDKIREAKS